MIHAELTFLGGAGTVTGSKHLLTIQDKKIMIDCGLFQGIKEERLLNWKPFAIPAKEVDAIVITHAHLDHTGYIPLLVKQGFHGPIYCSAPTAELAKLILLDSAKIQMEDAEHANQYGYSKHSPALPLYDTNDVEKTLPLFKILVPDQWHSIFLKQLDIRLSNSGHILGSTFVEARVGDKVIVFSGDLGKEHPLTLQPRKIIHKADVLVVESTYGDRCHPEEHPSESLAKIINDTISKDGHILIPAFAIGRTQDILFLLSKLKKENRIPNVPIYVDSPMADRATGIFDRYPEWHRLDSTALKSLSSTFQHVLTPEKSKELCESKTPSIVLAGSGMLTGGRIRHHLMTRISDSKNSIILVGFQAAGTLGRHLREGASEIKLYGKYLPVKAKIFEISSLSAHADQHEIISWISGFQHKPTQIFLVHGEPNASEGLRVRITDTFKIPVHIAKLNEKVSCF